MINRFRSTFTMICTGDASQSGTPTASRIRPITYPVLLTAQSFVMTWIWAASGGRTIVAILYPIGITGSAIMLRNRVVVDDARFSFLGNLSGVAVVECVAVAAGISLAHRDRAVLAVSAIGEEVGWRGFALPRLQRSTTALGASMLLVVVWTVWHLPFWVVLGEPRIRV